MYIIIVPYQEMVCHLSLTWAESWRLAKHV